MISFISNPLKNLNSIAFWFFWTLIKQWTRIDQPRWHFDIKRFLTILWSSSCLSNWINVATCWFIRNGDISVCYKKELCVFMHDRRLVTKGQSCVVCALLHSQKRRRWREIRNEKRMLHCSWCQQINIHTHKQKWTWSFLGCVLQNPRLSNDSIFLIPLPFRIAVTRYWIKPTFFIWILISGIFIECTLILCQMLQKSVFVIYEAIHICTFGLLVAHIV